MFGHKIKRPRGRRLGLRIRRPGESSSSEEEGDPNNEADTSSYSSGENFPGVASNAIAGSGPVTRARAQRLVLGEEEGESAVVSTGDFVDVGSINGDVHVHETEAMQDDEALSDKYSDSSDEEACRVCGSTRHWKKLINCDGCCEVIHTFCMEPKLQEVPKEKLFFCEPKCEQKYLKRIAESQEGTPQYAPANVDRSRSLLRGAAINIHQLRQKNPLSCASLKKWAVEGTGITKQHYEDVIDAIRETLERGGIGLQAKQVEALREASPPVDIVRTARSCGGSGVRKTLLQHRFEKLGVTCYFLLRHRCPYDAAMDLYESLAVRSRGPIYDWKTPSCDNGRVPSIKPDIETFGASMSVDLKNPANMIIPVGLYSDETISASGNVRFNPLWMYLYLMDPDARQIMGIDAHSLVAMLPEMASLQFSFSTDSKCEGTDDVPEANAAAEQLISAENKRKALKVIYRKSMRCIFTDWARYEQGGRVFGTPRSPIYVRLLLRSYIADMKERRLLLGLRGNVWHCSHCYDFSGKDNSEKLGLRSRAEDEKMRKHLANKTRQTKRLRLDDKKDFDEEHTKHGLLFSDVCPFTDTVRSRIYLKDGPYQVFMFEPLHMKDGVIEYYTKFVGTFLGEGFIEETTRFGNLYLRTKKFSMHIMEKNIESYHFIPLSLLFGKFEKDVTDAERQQLFLGSCDLLLILSLLNDPCPGFIMKDLEQAIGRFKAHVDWLVTKTGSTITTKLHELFSHVCDQIKRGGLPSSFSAKLLETFHQTIKELFTNSSKRRDGQAFGEMMDALFYTKAVEESRFFDSNRTELLPPRSQRWSEVAMFQVSKLQMAKVSLPEPQDLLKQNIELVRRMVFGQAHLLVEAPRILTSAACSWTYGNTWTMWIECTVRKVDISPRRVAVVPGTSRGLFGSGGAFNVLAFKGPEQSGPEGECDRAGQDIERKGGDCKGKESALREASTEGKADQAKKAMSEGAPGGRECNEKVQDCVGEESDCKGKIKRHCCRFHDERFELFSSASRRTSTHYGIPLLFFGPICFMWELVAVGDNSIPPHEAIHHLKVTEAVMAVSQEFVRGVSMAISHPVGERRALGECLVFQGINTFGFDA